MLNYGRQRAAERAGLCKKIMWIFFLVCQVFSPVYGLDVEIDQSEIQAKLEAKFPVKKTKGPFWIKL